MTSAPAPPTDARPAGAPGSTPLLPAFPSPHLLFRGATLALAPQHLHHLWFARLPAVADPNGLVIHRPSGREPARSLGTLARVRYGPDYQSEGVELLGVARVRLRAGAANALPGMGSEGIPHLSSEGVILIEDVVSAHSGEAAAAVKVAALRWLAATPELDWALEAAVRAEQPSDIADVVCQALFADSPQRAELLGITDVSARLAECHHVLAQLGFARPRSREGRAGVTPPVAVAPSHPSALPGQLTAPSFAVRAPTRPPADPPPRLRPVPREDPTCPSDCRDASDRPSPERDGAGPGGAGSDSGDAGTRPRPDTRPLPPIRPPALLRTFADVGGMEKLKAELRRSVGLLVRQPDAVAALDYRFSGVLLHGPPGVGKTHLAEATAGEFGLNFMRVCIGDVLSCWQGEGERHLRAVFAAAAARPPCLLFFDEFDALAAKRGGGGTTETFDRRLLDQLLGLLEDSAANPRLVVMAATNDLRALDPAAIREGRFDRQVFIDLPDRSARRAIFATHLRSRPVQGEIDLDDLADRTVGLSAAALQSIVVTAAGFVIEAMEEAPRGSAGAPRARITRALLERAIAERRGHDRPVIEGRTGWDDLILAPPLLDQLRRLVRMMSAPDELRRRGLRPLSGALLWGPPGTGKSTIARVVAAQTEGTVNFYPVSAPDILDGTLGTSSARVRDLFERARQYAPSLIFVDEVDALLHRRGGSDSAARERDSVVAEFLAQLDGLGSRPGVFVLAATNLPERLDPALTRSGRLTWRIEVPLPGEAERRALVRLFVRGIQLGPDVDLEAVADACGGCSGADIEAICAEAGYRTLERDDPVVHAADLWAALESRLRAPAAGSGYGEALGEADADAEALADGDGAPEGSGSAR